MSAGSRFTGKVALVTGAASGIGRATALRLAEEGAALLLSDVQAEALEATAKDAGQFGVETLTRVADVADPEDCRASVAACAERFGRLDALCNIAGILRMTHSGDVTLEDWNLVLAVNLTGTFFMCQAALPQLLEARGSIVNTSSTAALAGTAYAAAYSASKGGVLALTRALAIEYGKQGLRVNAVCPGSIKTAMTSRSVLPEKMDFELIKRVMPLDEARGPETVAAAIAFLASEDAAHVNGESLRVDGATLS
jgi:NAD(P)-dependent dehydrogenase (short-subunit alcohol dehydrogenase family)